MFQLRWDNRRLEWELLATATKQEDLGQNVTISTTVEKLRSSYPFFKPSNRRLKKLFSKLVRLGCLEDIGKGKYVVQTPHYR